MSSIESGIVDYLNNNAGVLAAIGTRLYAIQLPQKDLTLPAVTFTRISTERVITHDQTHHGLASPRFQFDVYATTYQEALDVADALRTALLGYRGTWDSIRVDAVLVELEQHDLGADAGLFRLIIDYKISHEE